MADFGGSIMEMDNGLEQHSASAEAIRELEKWRAKVEKADDEKARLMLEKLSEDDAKKAAQKAMEALLNKQEQCQQDFKETMKGIEDDILRLDEGNKDLMDKLMECQAELESRRAVSTKLQQKSKIYAQFPEMQVKFTSKEKEESEDSGHQIRGVFTISQRPTVLLKGGQALITFEEEKVASQILKMAKCSVSCENKRIDVKPKSLTLEPCVKFEIHIVVSKKELLFSNAPPSMSEERMRDRLEISFSRPSRGGGEVERVDYNQNTGKGKITFLHTGVAENLSLKRKYHVDLDSEVSVNVSPVYSVQLRKFQTFCGAPKRTILLDDIEDLGDEEDLQDHLEIHFQQPSNYGGEVETIKYISSGKNLEAYFSEDMVEAEA